MGALMTEPEPLKFEPPEFDYTEPKKPRRRRRGGGLSQEEMLRTYPVLKHLAGPPGKETQKAWSAVFNTRPDVMHNLLADYFKQAHAQPGRIGQRPMPKEEQVDFQTLVYGEQNDLPLIEVLPKLLTMSERNFATRLNMSRSQFQRLMKGEYQPNVHELRAIASAVKKPATFFVEYRRAMVVSAFLTLIEDRPGIATTLYKQYLEVRVKD